MIFLGFLLDALLGEINCCALLCLGLIDLMKQRGNLNLNNLWKQVFVALQLLNTEETAGVG